MTEDPLAERIAAHLSTEIHWADDEIAPERCQMCWFITELKGARYDLHNAGEDWTIQDKEITRLEAELKAAREMATKAYRAEEVGYAIAGRVTVAKITIEDERDRLKAHIAELETIHKHEWLSDGDEYGCICGEAYSVDD